MGRHRRSAAGRAAEVHRTDGSAGQGRHPSGAGDRPTMGIAPYLNPEAYAEVRAKSDAYLFGPDDRDGEGRPEASLTVPFPSEGFTPDDGPQRGGSRRRRKKRAVTPVRTGLLGVSAAVALGTVAVATGAVPGLDNYRIGGAGGGDRVQSADVPTNNPAEQGGTSGSADAGLDGGASASSGADRSVPPSAPASPSSPSASASPSSSASTSAAPAETPSKTEEPEASTPSRQRQPTPSRPATKAPERKTAAPAGTVSEQAVAEARVLQLVNDERAKAGCSPVAANSALRELAEDFSEAMAAQGFFDHTDPSGATPWDRAEAAGISDLGGENIARGQADAQAVMDAWMDSPGHKANILNCDFRTLGVGVHFGPGGPWWTQDFGY
ncbi:CAP domain-containing protein [Streptomyces flaveolus]|uniref:CAP domain-containing protein n=1 Tax=Streptomyces flaveolus TaxID=67297 RepID=UPI001670E007|nr:CAP domain-containing protein [Streptomyces flaveolus]GGQ87205.1 membrane protein [Streptomyces flaveolus]